MTQHDRILELCKDGSWVCQSAFHPISWSPHKRRKEIESKFLHEDGTPKYTWEERKCEHNIPGSKDFKLIQGHVYNGSLFPHPISDSIPS